MALTLVIGNKKYSSWSMRPWIALRVAGIAFEEVVIPLYLAESKPKILAYSPAGKVPILIDGEVRVWESLAILDYLADRFPQAGLWPADIGARAHARAISAEMHAGFVALRSACSMNVARQPRAAALSAEARANVARIDAIWSDARERYGKHGDFLFGAFSAADAMYAPVVSRCATYQVRLSPVAQAYADAVRGLPAYREWIAAGIAEPWTLPQFEE